MTGGLKRVAIPIPIPIPILMVVVAGCSSRTPAARNTPSSVPPIVETGSSSKSAFTFSGSATIDGKPLSAKWIGAIVRDNGLLTPCQVTLPDVQRGTYAIQVYAEHDSAGCGHKGAEVIFWTFTDDKLMFAARAVPWPHRREARADITFLRTRERGAAPEQTEFFGAVYTTDGRPLPAGTHVSAYIGGTLCGVASTRTGDFNGYLISVVGPASRRGCERGGTITFRVNDRVVKESRVNGRSKRDAVDLVVEGAT